MIQIITGCSIVVLGMYIFKKYPMKKEAKSLAIGAFLVVMVAILKRVSIMIPLFGVPALKIGFEMIPLMMAGFVLSPSYAFIVGITADLVGLMITPTDFPFLGFTLNSVLTTCIPALTLDITKTIKAEKIAYFIKIIVGILIVGVSGYIVTLDTITVSKENFVLHTPYKIGIIAICITWGILLWSVMRYMEKRVADQDKKMFYVWMIVVIITELSISFLLTPYWLQVMYEIPFMISLFVRVIKQCIMIPVGIIVGYQLLKIIRKI